MSDLRRSDLLRGAAAAGVALAAGHALPARAAEPVKLSYGDLYSGVTGIVSSNITANRFDLKHGIDMANALPYTAVSTYYNDFAAGTFDVAMGSWDFFIDMYNKGVPIKLICTITTADMINIIATPQIKSVNDLAGKGVSAVIGSGSFEMSRAVLRATAKLDLDHDVQMQNAPNPAGCIALLQAGSTVAALTWEPVISDAMAKEPALRTIFNLGAIYRRATGTALPYFCVAARTDALKKDPSIAGKIAATFGDTIAYINHETSAAFTTAAAKTGLPSTIMHTGFDAGRLTFSAYPMQTPAGRKVVETAFAYMHARGMFDKPLSPDFFA